MTFNWVEDNLSVSLTNLMYSLPEWMNIILFCVKVFCLKMHFGLCWALWRLQGRAIGALAHLYFNQVCGLGSYWDLRPFPSLENWKKTPLINFYGHPGLNISSKLYLLSCWSIRPTKLLFKFFILMFLVPTFQNIFFIYVIVNPSSP